MTQQELLAIKQRFGIIGQSPLLNRDIEIAVQVARTDLSVLITGESGVGKEHFPKIIHAFSSRKHGSVQISEDSKEFSISPVKAGGC